MQTTLANLCAYITVVAKCLDDTTRAEDRDVYTQHLAAAARMFVAVHAGQRTELDTIVASERHAYGWGYLSGPEGKVAERAFDQFAKTIEAEHAA